MRTLSLFLIALSMTAADPAAKPNFSGTWVLNLDRSEFGTQATPKKLVQKISHKGVRLDVESTEVSPLDQEVKLTLNYLTDGKETSNTVGGTEVKSTASWSGSELSVHSRSTFGGRSVDLKDRWKLAEAGETLIVSRRFEGSGGTVDQVLVFDKK